MLIIFHLPFITGLLLVYIYKIALSSYIWLAIILIVGKIYYTYVLKSSKDNKLYIGHTNNLKKRLVEHNKGVVDSTKSRRPLKLIYYEACLVK